MSHRRCSLLGRAGVGLGGGEVKAGKEFLEDCEGSWGRVSPFLRPFPSWGRSPGGGQDNPLQYSCPENPMDRGAWRATVHRVEELDPTERLNGCRSTVLGSFAPHRKVSRLYTHLTLFF